LERNTHPDRDEDVVLCLGLATDVQLLDAEGEAGGDVLKGPCDAVESGVQHAGIISKIFYDGDLLRPDALDTE